MDVDQIKLNLFRKIDKLDNGTKIHAWIAK